MVMNVFKLFLTLPLYWALFAQCNSRWVFQAKRMDGDIGFYKVEPDQMPMLVTFFIIILIPFYNCCLFPILLKFGIKTPLQKITCGFFLGICSFLVATFIEWKIQQERICILWLVPQYFILAASETFIWVSNLSFAYTQAPESMKSVVSSFSYIAIAGGSLIVIIISGSNLITSQFWEFLLYTGLMTIDMLWFMYMAKNYKFVENK